MSIEQNMSTDIPQNAISLYHQDNAMDDFPVLKAFQQYIDAEQIKSRKRMVTLCIFFGILMTIVVAVFMFMLHAITTRNQQLNDRLVEYAMRDRQPAIMPQPPVSQSSAANEAAMQAMTDTLVALQKQIAEQQRQQPALISPAPAPAAAPVAAAPMSSEESDIDRKTRAAEEKLRKARALLDAEKKKLAEERERLRQEEIERHRRRLYPEYYGDRQQISEPVSKARQSDAQPQSAQQKAKPAKRQLSDDDIADILREVDEAQATLPDGDGDDVLDDDVEDAIEYFQDDEIETPEEVRGTSTKWHVPLD